MDVQLDERSLQGEAPGIPLTADAPTEQRTVCASLIPEESIQTKRIILLTD